MKTPRRRSAPRAGLSARYAARGPRGKADPGLRKFAFA